MYAGENIFTGTELNYRRKVWRGKVRPGGKEVLKKQTGKQMVRRRKAERR